MQQLYIEKIYMPLFVIREVRLQSFDEPEHPSDPSVTHADSFTLKLSIQEMEDHVI